MQAQNEKTITYRVEYSSENGTCGGVDLEPLTLTTSDFSTILQVMELAATQANSYLFSTTFSAQDKDAGYVVDSINNTRTVEPCYWSVYVQSGDTEIMPDVGISSYVPGDGFHVILRHEDQVDISSVTTIYVIDYPDAKCTTAMPPDSISIATPTGSTALDVMVKAATLSGSDYAFSTDYMQVASSAEVYGYVVTQVGGVDNNGSCIWVPFLTPLGRDEVMGVAVSDLVVPGDGYTLTLRYYEPEEPTTAPTPSSAAKVHNYVHH